MTTFIVLLRGVNVGGNNKVPMADLKKACEKAGFANVRTYVNSGNVVLDGPGKAAQAEAKVEALLAKGFSVSVPVVARDAKEWPAYVAANPFPDAQPKSLHLCLSKARPKPDAVEALQAKTTARERAAVAGGALWIDFAGNVARSKLTPAAIDKAVGSPTTARNWNTVQKLAEMVGAP